MPFSGVSETLPTGTPRISREGLVLAYDMNSLTRRGEMRDFSGNSNDGVVVGTHGVPGPFGTARAFRSSGDYVRLPSSRSMHIRGSLSIAVWVNLRQLAAHQHIVAYDDLYSLWIDERDRLRFSDTRGNAFESHPGLIPGATWTSIVASFDGRRGTALDAGNIAVHVNGEPARGRMFGAWNPGRPVVGFVGKEAHVGQSTLPFLGDLAAVLIFRRPLSGAEAKAFADVPSLGRRGPIQAPPQVELPRSSALERTSLAGFEPETPSDGAFVGEPDAPPASTRIHVAPRVVRITNLIPPYRLPTLELLLGSPSIHFEQWVMSASEGNRRWDFAQVASRVRLFRDWGVDLSRRDMFTAHFNPGMLLELSRRPPDLVILGGYEQPTCLQAGFLLERMGIPFLLSSESISLRDSLAGRRVPFLVQKLVQRSEGVIVPGRASRTHFLDLGVPADRIFVAPNAVDAERFAPSRSIEEKQATRRALGLPDKTLCLYVGRLTPDKGIGDLLDAFASTKPDEKNLHLVIAGEGRLRAQIESRISEDQSLRGTVSLVGYVEEQLLPKYYLASDIFVFPTRRDIWGLVLNEAMCAGVPAVASDGAAGALDLIEDGVSGLLFPRGQPRDLAAAIGKLLEDPPLRIQMGNRARERILAGFTPEHQARGFLQAIHTTLGRPGHPVGDLPGIDAPRAAKDILTRTS